MRSQSFSRISRRVSWPLLALLLSLVQLYPYILSPTLQAEEGTVFLASLLSRGSTQWINAGYLNLFTGAGILSVWTLAPQAMPWLCILIALSVQIGCGAILLGDAWEELAPRRWRIGLFLALTAFSPFREGHGILLYSFWYLGLGSFFILLECLFLRGQLSSFRWLWILVAVLSGPPALQLIIALAPFAWQKLRSQRYRLGWSQVEKAKWAALLLAFIVQVLAILGNRPAASAVTLGWVFPWDLVRASLHQGSLRVLAPVFFSETQVAMINGSRIFAYVLFFTFFVLSATLLVSLKRHRRSDLILALFIGICAQSMLTYLGRPQLMDQFKHQPYNLLLEGSRYSMLQGLLALAILTSYLGSLQPGKLNKCVIVMILGFFFQARVIDSRIPHAETPVPWMQLVNQVTAFQNDPSRQLLEVEILPRGWFLRVEHSSGFRPAAESRID